MLLPVMHKLIPYLRFVKSINKNSNLFELKVIQNNMLVVIYVQIKIKTHIC